MRVERRFGSAGQRDVPLDGPEVERLRAAAGVAPAIHPAADLIRRPQRAHQRVAHDALIRKQVLAGSQVTRWLGDRKKVSYDSESESDYVLWPHPVDCGAMNANVFSEDLRSDVEAQPHHIVDEDGVCGI